MAFFDAHLDLAYLAERGRDMASPDLGACGGPHPPAAVTFASLSAGRVTSCLGTIFTQGVPEPGAAGAATGTHTYPLGDAEAAHRAALRQLDRYHRWQREGVISLIPRRADPRRRREPNPAAASAPLRLGILMECADPIRTPDELPFWADRGVIAIGLVWVHAGRYAAGNTVDPADPSAGLTDLGRSLVRAMDDLGLVHDLSHLSQRATDQLLELTDAPVIASHSNCRALFDHDPTPNARQRHLSDDTIKEIARRDGVIGINLFSDFLDPDLPRGHSASVDAVVRHIAHIAALVGHSRAIGLGTDMDGGFSADRLPHGIRAPEDLRLLVDALAAHGVAHKDIEAITRGNWSRFWDVQVQA